MSAQPRASATAGETAARPFFLARLALAVVVPLIVYASLRPFSGWRSTGRHPFAYLRPTGELGSPFDALLNAAGYFVLAACLVLALYPRVRGRAALWLGLGLPALGSALVEAAQTYLPGRQPSLIDLITNTLGAMLGAALAVRCTPWLTDHRGGRRWRERWLQPGRFTEVGLLLLAAWFVGVFAQRTLLFGSGDIRGNLQREVVAGVPAWVYAGSEVFVVAANIVVLALLLRWVLADLAVRGMAALGVVALAVVAALVARLVAQVAFWPLAAAWQWVTPMAPWGVALGVVLATAAMQASRRAAALLALAVLVAAVAVVNLAPPDPLLWQQPTPPRQRLLIGLALVARYVSKAWPLAAAVYFVLAWRRAGPRLPGDEHRAPGGAR